MTHPFSRDVEVRLTCTMLMSKVDEIDDDTMEDLGHDRDNDDGLYPGDRLPTIMETNEEMDEEKDEKEGNSGAHAQSDGEYNVPGARPGEGRNRNKQRSRRSATSHTSQTSGKSTTSQGSNLSDKSQTSQKSRKSSKSSMSDNGSLTKDELEELKSSALKKIERMAKKHSMSNLNIKELVRCGEVSECFPLHEKLSILWFKEHWSYWRMVMKAPIDNIGDYFGEKIALYMYFMAFATRALMWVAVVGICIQALEFIGPVGSLSNFMGVPLLPIIAYFIVVWAVVVLEVWKQQEAIRASCRGMSFYEEKEPDRPGFDTVIDGETQIGRSCVTGKRITYFPVSERVRREVASRVTMALVLLAVISMVAGVFILRSQVLYPDPDYSPETSQNIASAINAVQVIVGNVLIEKLVDSLTEYENHRTSTMFEDAYCQKMFAFVFVNSYGSFLYTAFVAQHMPKPVGSHGHSTGECGDSTCLPTLELSVLSVMVLRVAKGVALLLYSYLQVGRHIISPSFSHFHFYSISSPFIYFSL